MGKLTRRRRRRPRKRPQQGDPVQPGTLAARSQITARLQEARQAKPDLTQAAQRQENEADRIATHAVTHGPDAAPMSPATAPAPPAQAKPDGASATPAGPASAPGHVPAHVPALGPGTPLDPTQKARFAGPLGDPLTGTRIDTTGHAARTTRALAAKAVTIGQTIGFAPGQYQPHSREGAHLLAHELTHVVQQKRGGPTVQRSPDPSSYATLDLATGGADAFWQPTRQTHFVTTGETLTSIATGLLPQWQAAAKTLPDGQRAGLSDEIMTAPGLAKALLVHHQSLLSPPHMTPWQDGLRVPLPMLRDPSTGALTVDVIRADQWLSGWSGDWAAALTLAAPPATAATDDVPLVKALLANPAAALPLAQKRLGPADADAGQIAFDIMQMLDAAHLATLSEHPATLQILPLIDAALRANRDSLDPALTTRALNMLAKRQQTPAPLAEDVERAYLAFTGSGCMNACYMGLSTLMGPDRSAAVARAVADKDRRASANLDTVITMMETLQDMARAGPPLIFEQDKPTRVWDRDPDVGMAQLVAARAEQPGYYFFGLSAVTGYHTVMLLLDLRDPGTPRLLWLDQDGTMENTNIYGKLKDHLNFYTEMAITDPKLEGKEYKLLRTKIWPLYVPSGTALPLDGGG